MKYTLLRLGIFIPVVVAPAVPLDNSTLIPLRGTNYTIPFPVNATSNHWPPSSSLVAPSSESLFSWDWGQKPPSGYHVPTSCIARSGDVEPMLTDDTRTGVAAWQTCEDAYISWAYSASLTAATLSNGIINSWTEGLYSKTPRTSYSIPSRCMSMCTIGAARVQLLYWPTPYSTPGNNATLTSASRPKMSIGPDGFSFISPTAYVIYSGVGVEAPAGFPGSKTYDNITQAYAPTQLSTFYSCDAPYVHSSQINFQDFNVPPRWSVISAHQSCDWCQQQYLYPDPQQPGDALATGYANMNLNQIPWFTSGQSSWILQPTLAALPGLTDIDPYWKHCTSLYRGIWDPPRRLSAVAELTPTATEASTSSSASAAISTDTAAPASLLIDPLASLTSTSGAIDPVTSIQAVTHTSSSGVDPPTKATASPWPLDSLEDPRGTSKDPTEATKISSTGTKKGSSPESSWDPVPTQDPPSVPNPGSTASLSPATSLQPSLAISGIRTVSSSPLAVTTGDTTADFNQGETGKVSLGSISNVEGSTSSSTEPTANVHPLTMTSFSNSLPHIEPPYVLLTTSSPDDGGLSLHKDTAGAVKTTYQAMGTLTVPPGDSLMLMPHVGINALGQTFTPLNAATVAVQDTSLSVGGEALTMHDVRVSMGSLGLIVGTTTIAMPGASTDPAEYPTEQTDVIHASTTTAGGRIWTLGGGNQIMADGVTLSRGSHAVTLDGTSFSLGSIALFAGTITIPMPVAAAATSPTPLVTVSGKTIEQLGHGRILWNGVAITEGASAITVHGSSVSYGSSGLMLGTSIIAIPSKTTNPSELGPFSVAGVTFTPISNSLLVVDGDTLFVGSTARVVDGKTMSFGSSGLIVGTSTVSIPNSDSTTSDALGNIIMSGFGTGPAASATSVEAFKGAALVDFRRGVWWTQALSIGIGFVTWLLWW